jgi:hypothetical protein
MTKQEWRTTWIGAGIAVAASLVFTAIAASFESTINGPGTRNIAPPVLWGLGGGLGLSIGALITSWLTRRWWPGAQAAFFGGVAFLVLVLLAYNHKDLRLEDQVVGSLFVVVLPAFLAGLLAAWLGKLASRLLRPPPAGRTA